MTVFSNVIFFLYIPTNPINGYITYADLDSAIEDYEFGRYWHRILQTFWVYTKYNYLRRKEKKMRFYNYSQEGQCQV